MRRFASAILMFVLFFNLYGYRFVADYIQAKNDINLEARLDNNRFDDSQLIELKVPINLPYQTSWSEFERYDGEVELNGVLYKYVKRKVSNDTLILLCIPNQQKMDLQMAKNDFFRNANDLAQNDHSKKPGTTKSIDIKKLVTEYDDQCYRFDCRSIKIDQGVFNGLDLVNILLSSPHISPEQPPDISFA